MESSQESDGREKSSLEAEDELYKIALGIFQGPLISLGGAGCCSGRRLHWPLGQEGRGDTRALSLGTQCTQRWAEIQRGAGRPPQGSVAVLWLS